MGLIHRSDLETSSSIQNDLVIDLNNSNRDILTTRTAVSYKKYPTIYQGLLKYASGSNITVTYYRKYGSYLDKQSEEYAFSLEKSDVDLSYDRINNLQIVLKSALDISYNDESGEMIVNGEGYLYPRSDPKIGDVFLYTLYDNTIGVFIIDNITPLTLSSNTQYDVTFHLYSFLNDEIYNKLNINIRNNYYFSKNQFIENDISLLTEQSYYDYNKIRKLEYNIFSDYMSQFYNREIQGILNIYEIAPDNIINYYDCYLTEFLYNCTNISDSKYYLKQYNGNLVDDRYGASIFSALSNKDIYRIKYNYFILLGKQFNLYDADITSVIKYKYLDIVDSEDSSIYLKNHINNYLAKDDFNIDYYIFSEFFYNRLTLLKNNNLDLSNPAQNLDDLDKIEQIVIKFFYYNDFFNEDDFKNSLFDILLNYRTIINIFSEYKQKYYIPIIIFFIKIAKRLLR